jgi:hypothetical protein
MIGCEPRFVRYVPFGITHDDDKVTALAITALQLNNITDVLYHSVDDWKMRTAQSSPLGCAPRFKLLHTGT